MNIDSVEQLRALYPAPKERSVKKQLAALDAHCKRFIQLSPFVVLASSSTSSAMDASPRGGTPGFVKVLDERTLLIPDAPGNNRLDTLENIIGTGKIGLFFMIPGVDETLRINGTARLSCHAEHLAHFDAEKRRPKLAIQVSVAEAYLHCAKALMRSSLWQASSQVDRSSLPTMGQMLNSQTGIQAPAETQEEMVARYATEL
jgi:PPOX class probable FMN-dependent enzyme